MKKTVSGITIICLLLMSVFYLGGCAEKKDPQNTEISKESTEDNTEVSKEDTEDNNDGKNSLTIPRGVDIGDINAHLYNGDMVAQGIVFEGLVKNTSEGIKPCLAKKWDVSEDGKEYTFYLREDVKFTDGEVFNAEAVKSNIEAVQANKESHSWLELSNKIQDCQVIDEYTVKLVLSDSYYPALVELGLTRPYRIMSPATFIDGKTSDGVTEIAGTGPYKLKEYKENQYATFVANENYWGKVPQIENLKMVVMPSGETPLMAMLNGEVDLIFSSDASSILNVDSLLSLKENSKFKMKFSQPCSTRYLLTNNQSDRIISDKNIKNAVWQAINREELAKYIMSDLESPAETIYADSFMYCDVGLEPKEFNTNKSKSLIEKSGWSLNESTGYYEKDGAVLKLELVYSSSAEQNKTICEFIQANLKEVGIEVELVPSESNSVRQLRSAGKYDIYLDRSWGIPYDPQTSLTALFAPESYLNSVIDLEDYDELYANIQKALITVDEKERQECFNKALHIIHEEAPFIPLTYTKAIVVAPKDLKGITFNETQLELPIYDFYY